ncbi:F-box domain-containing protein [Xylaria sp. FL1777]|nr:F-box domain-containing protein [Xylaria sp. FL1777]
MSSVIFRCVICGYLVYDHRDLDSVSWINQFRILYSSRDVVAVTGVGISRNGEGDWSAPLDFTARWDNELPATRERRILGQSPANGRYDFPFHEACWSLLEKAYCPKPIPHETLFRVCSSLPYPSRGSGLSWGNSHGGLTFVGHHCYPWEDPYVERDINSVLPSMRYDPYHVPEILRLRHEEPQVPAVSGPMRQTTDCFLKLPEEIIILISLYLPTADALNVRRASGSFLPIFSSQQFWASRFETNADRSWLFESQEWDKTYDRRWLYHSTNKAHCTEGMNNRKRVWKLIQRIQRVLSLRWEETSASDIAGITGLRWQEATGDLRPETPRWRLHHFDEGCRLFREQHTPTPLGKLSHIAFSIIKLSATIYITGIRLILNQGQAIQLGYRAENEVIVPIHTAQLIGFKLAVGSRGIQGLKCVFDDQSQSQWVGCPDDAPRTQRLMLSSPITAIKAGFDGFKAVSLAVAESIPLPEGRSLRDSAFWYPRVPPAGLHFNDLYFTKEDTAATRYQPLCWAMFGGPGGIYLRSIIGLSVTCHSVIHSMKFHYNSKEVPVECRKLGRYRTKGTNPIHFPIDGPGGEIINSVTVCVYRDGILESFKVTTNHGRSCHFGAIDADPDIVEKPITVAPGSTINGFYWSQYDNCFMALGVISEMIDQH